MKDKKEKTKCSRLSEYTSKGTPLKTKYIDKCDHDAHYVVSYKRGTDGKIMEGVLMCKKHFNALTKNAARMIKNGWDAQIKFELYAGT